MRVCPATQLARVLANRDDAHLVAVLLVEHHDRTHLARLLHGHDLPPHRQVVHAAIVDDAGHLSNLLAVNRARIVEVEAQLVGTDVRALLARALAEHVLQRAVQEVGRRVMSSRAIATRRIHLGTGEFADVDLALGDSAIVEDVVRAVEARVFDHEHAARGANPPRIADLAAALRVERRGLQDQTRSRSLRSYVKYCRLTLRVGPGQKLRGRDDAQRAAYDPDPGRGILCPMEPGACAGALPLGFERRLVAFSIKLQTLLAQHLLGQLHWEAVCLVQVECALARNSVVAARAGLAHQPFDLRRARLQRSIEQLFLVAEDVLDTPRFGLQLRVVRPHSLDDGVDQIRQERPLDAQAAPVANGSASDASQHVLPTAVAGDNTSQDQKRRGPRVIGQHTQRVVSVPVAAVFDLGDALGSADDGLEQVSLVDRLETERHHRGALDAHARIDVLFGQQRADAVLVLVVLHEHQVPELEPTTVAVWRIFRKAAAEAAALLVVQLTVRPARARLARRPPPVVLVAEALDPLLRDARLQPQLVGFVVGVVDGDPQPFLLEAHVARRKLECPRDDLCFEVVAQREIAEHLEEREMTAVADFLDVRGTEALLDRYVAGVGWALPAQEVRHELLHPGGSQQDRRIVVRDQAGRRLQLAAAGLPELNELGAYVVARARARALAWMPTR